jgi:hypothetical protein
MMGDSRPWPYQSLKPAGLGGTVQGLLVPLLAWAVAVATEGEDPR